MTFPEKARVWTWTVVVAVNGTLSALLLNEGLVVVREFQAQQVRLDAGNGLSRTNTMAQDLLKDAKDSLDANYDDLRASNETTAVILRQTSDLLSDVHAGTVGGKNAHGKVVAGLLPEATSLLSQTRTSIQSIQADVTRLTTQLGESAKPLGEATQSLTRLVDDLDAQVKAGGPEVVTTIATLRRTIEDLDKLVAPTFDAEGMPTGVGGIIYHADESVKSLDIALRPLRQKVNQLKWVLNKLLDAVKVTLSAH